MINCHVIGRVGKDAEVKNGKNGDFMSMDIAVDNYTKGEQKTTWIRVKSSRSNHINLAKHLTKGRVLLVQGTLPEPSVWKDKNGNDHVQLSIIADSIEFVKTGKKQDAVRSENVPAPPTEAPENNDDLPF